MNKKDEKNNNAPSLWKKIRRSFKAWLTSERRDDGGRGAALAVFALLLIAALYYVGVFDFTLIGRPESWRGNADEFYSIWYGKSDESGDAEGGDETEHEEKNDASPDRVSSVEHHITGRTSSTDKTKVTFDIKTREALAEEGLYLTDAEFIPGESAIGKIDFSFNFPKKFTYRDMNTRTWKVTDYNDGRMSTVEDTVTATPRPALYLYMGYVIYDDRGKALYLIDRNGAVLSEYDDTFLPAFARDTYGRPLFYTTYGYYTDVPETDEVNEAGEHTFTYKGAYLTGKNYFALTYGGYFAASNYVEERDGRGLNFDFPPYYGLSDSAKYRVGIMSPKYSTFLDGKSDLVNFMNWNYFSLYDPARPDVGEIISAEKEYALLTTEEKLAAIEAGTTPEDIYHVSELFPYLAAYNYSEGYATVLTDDVDEEPKYAATELRVINAYGDVMFTSRKKYSNDVGAYLSDRFMLPLSRGEDAVGQLYFDHGLMRIRKVSYDIFQLEEYDDFRVIESDVLVSPTGREFAIPEGYTLVGYSNGVMTLKRGDVYGCMSYDGRWIANPEYSSCATFHCGVGVLTAKDGSVGAIDEEGNVVIPFNYSYISNCSDGLIAAYSEDGGWELFGVFSR